MKRGNIFWGFVLILSAVLIIIDAFGKGLGFLSSVPVVKIILGVLCLAWVIAELCKKKIPHIFFPLSFIFMLFEGEIAKAAGMASDNIMSNWLVLLCALLLTIGTSIIFAKAFPNISKISKHYTDAGGQHIPSGSSVKYIDCATFVCEIVSNELGSCEIFFENTDEYTGDGTLNISNRLGSTEIHVPKKWHVHCDVENSLGNVDMRSSGNTTGPILNITGTNRLGNIEIYPE